MFPRLFLVCSGKIFRCRRRYYLHAVCRRVVFTGQQPRVHRVPCGYLRQHERRPSTRAPGNNPPPRKMGAHTHTGPHAPKHSRTGRRCARIERCFACLLQVKEPNSSAI